MDLNSWALAPPDNPAGHVQNFRNRERVDAVDLVLLSHLIENCWLGGVTSAGA